jgi:hypothetical protein
MSEIKNKMNIFHIIIIIICLVSLIIIQFYIFPYDIDRGLYFSIDIDREKINNITTPEIYNILSKEDDLKLENITNEIYLGNHSNNTSGYREDISQIKVTSNNWCLVSEIYIWVYPNGDIGLDGDSSVVHKYMLDRNAFSRSVDNSREKVMEIMNRLDISIKESEISIDDNDFSFIPVYELCCMSIFFIIFLMVISIYVVIKNYKVLKEKLFTRERINQNTIKKQEFSLSIRFILSVIDFLIIITFLLFILFLIFLNILKYSI